MDLALGFTSPVRRNSKMELPLSVYRTKSFDNSVSIPIPMQGDSSNMFETSGSCRITRWLYPHYGSNHNFMNKSTQLNKGGTALQKIIIPKGPTLAISISQQTIVGGFVGSKAYAGRSMFGDSSQVWDAVVCKFVELMSLVKEKPSSVGPKRKVPSSDKCNSSVDYHKNSQPETSKESMCVSESVFCSRKCVPRNHRVINLADNTNKFSRNAPYFAPTECKAVIPEHKELTLNSGKDALLSHGGTYNSVVEGTHTKDSARVGSCTLINSNPQNKLPVGHQTNLQRGPLQSYAEVAKIIPSKLKAPPSKSGCVVAQNLKNIWNSKMKRNNTNQDKSVNCKGIKCNNVSVDDIVSNGDTRWKGDWKSKRVKFQKCRPTAEPINTPSNLRSDALEENNVKECFTKEMKTDMGSECKWTTEEREPIRVESLKDGFRGRYPSECSLDSEDSFVIFEECPDTALAAPSPLPVDSNSSVEESESEDDDNSSSDSSDYEIDNVDSGDHPLRFDYLTSNLCVTKDRYGVNKCSANTVPEKSNGMKKKTVHFAEGSHLAVIRPMIAWGYAYRESRRGQWEVHARDRARFHCRIASLAPVLNAILDPIHRRKVVASRLHDF